MKNKQNNSFRVAAVPHLDGLQDGNYVWVGDFDDHALREFYHKFTEMEANPAIQIIPIIISSYGGDISVMIAMRDLIKSCSKPVATIAIGKAMSAGAALLAAGHKGLRFAGSDTILMVHEVSSGVEGKTAEMFEKIRNTVYLNDLMFKNLSNDTGTPQAALLKPIRDRNNADWYFDAATAKKVGLIDIVGIPRNETAFHANNLRLLKPEKVKRK